MNTTQIDTQTIKNYMERPESPLKINETFEKNYRKNCDALGVPCTFNNDIQMNNFNKASSITYKLIKMMKLEDFINNFKETIKPAYQEKCLSLK